MPLIASNPTPRVILGLMTFGPDESTGKGIPHLRSFHGNLAVKSIFPVHFVLTRNYT